MKKIVSLLLIISVIAAFSCQDDTTSHVSFVTSYPVFKLEGDALISVIGDGSAFVDPGVTATEAGKELPVTTSGTVNTSVSDLYIVTYSAKNSDGYTGTATRQVVITLEDVSGTDLTGTYLRNNDPARPITKVTKVLDGYYFTPNGSGDGNEIAFNFIHSGGTDIVIPIQNSIFGRFQGTGSITDDGLSWVITLLDGGNAGITLTRNLFKQ